MYLTPRYHWKLRLIPSPHSPQPPFPHRCPLLPPIARLVKQKAAAGDVDMSTASGGRKGAEGRAATIAPASAVGSRIGSRAGSRAGSRIGSRHEERLVSSEVDMGVNVFYTDSSTQKVTKTAAAASGVAAAAATADDGSHDAGAWFAASRRAAADDEEEKAVDTDAALSSANAANALGEQLGLNLTLLRLAWLVCCTGRAESMTWPGTARVT